MAQTLFAFFGAPWYSVTTGISKWRNKESRRTMNIKLGDTHTIRWATTDPATGAAADASAQTVSIYEEATDTAIVTPTATKASTGSYRADIVATSGNGFEAGKAYNVEVAATVGGVATKMFVLTFKVDSKAIDDLASTGAQMNLANDAITAAKIATNAIDADAIAADAVTKIASGVAVAGAATRYSPTAATRVVGDNEGGSYTDLAAHDDVSMQTGEVVGTGLEVVVTVGTSTTTENPSLVRVSGFYNGGVGHQINVQVYNYTSSAWDTVGVILSRSSAFDYTFPLTTDDHNPSTGEMKIRFVHNVTTYNATHYLALDYVSFEKVATNSQLASDIALIVSKVTPLPASPAAVGSAMTLATNAVSADALATDAVTEIVNGVWDEVLTGATHNVNASAGKRLRTLAQTVISSDVAQGPGTGSNQIQLSTAEPSVDGTFDPAIVAIVGGTGAGQCRRILEYKGSTRAATVNRNWKVAPDATSEYIIYADAGGSSTNEGLLRAASSNTAQLNTLASSADDAYVGQTLWVVSGTGDDQSRLIVAYNGSTKTATIDGTWAITPDTTSAYVLLPTASVFLGDGQADQLTDIKAKTDNLPSDPADQSLVIAATDQIRSDIAAIPAAPSTTDILSAMNATPPATNIKKVNDITIKGSGTTLDPWNPV